MESSFLLRANLETFENFAGSRHSSAVAATALLEHSDIFLATSTSTGAAPIFSFFQPLATEAAKKNIITCNNGTKTIIAANYR